METEVDAQSLTKSKLPTTEFETFFYKFLWIEAKSSTILKSASKRSKIPQFHIQSQKKNKFNQEQATKSQFRRFFRPLWSQDIRRLM